MEEHISDRVKRLSVSATLAMAQKTSDLRASGVDVIGLAAGEPDFNTPEHIKDAAKKAIDDNYSHYTAVAGYESLRQAICDKLLKENGLEYRPSQIVVGNGAKQELANTILAMINPGDEVVIPVPAWVSYVDMVKLAGGTPVLVHTRPENRFKMTPAELEGAITPGTRLLMLNSPSNPTGSVYSAAEIEALAEALQKYPEVGVISDEIYEHINYTGSGLKSIAACPGMKERTVVVNGVSKAYAMTGWRIGWMAAPQWLAKAVVKLQGQYTSGASSIAQKAAAAAYTGSQECVEEMRRAFERRRDLICRLADEVPGWHTDRPEGAFYIFPDVRALMGKRAGNKLIESSSDYVMYLLEEAHVGCVDGGAFGVPGFIRLSYATSDDNIREAMHRIREATMKLSE